MGKPYRPAECNLPSVYKARPLRGLCSDAPNDCRGCFYYGLLQHGTFPEAVASKEVPCASK